MINGQGIVLQKERLGVGGTRSVTSQISMVSTIIAVIQMGKKQEYFGRNGKETFTH